VLLVFGAPCPLRLLAGQEHGRTIPLGGVAKGPKADWHCSGDPVNKLFDVITRRTS